MEDARAAFRAEEPVGHEDEVDPELDADFVNLGDLKGNIGNQNYDIPEGTDLSKYDTVIIWCKAFSVFFGGAELTSGMSA